MDALDRTLQPTRGVLGDVDLAQPLDLTHPLLDGVEGFWLPLPRLVGGSRLYDLSSYNNTTTSNNGWKFSNGEFNVDGRHDVEVESAFTSDNYSVLAKVYVNKFAESKVLGNDTGNFQEVNFGLGAIFDSNQYPNIKRGYVFRFDENSNLGSNNPIDQLEEVILVAQLLNSGDSVRLFVDGELSNQRSNVDVGNAVGPLQLGLTTDLDLRACVVSNRFWSENEVSYVSEQARRGFPDLLRRRDSVGLLGGGGGGTADTVSFNTGAALADGFEPTITATANTVSSGTAQAAAQGFSATITATQNTVSAGTAQATAQGFEPAITTGSNTVAATTGQAAAQGFDPTISEGAAGDTLVADLGTAQAQGFVPTITTNPATVTLGLGQATANGFDPDVVADPSEINTGQAQAAATGFDPTITTNARNVTPQLGTAQAQGFEPAVVDGTVGVATTMEIEARPLYEIDVEAKPLYRIRLFVKEQLP